MLAGVAVAAASGLIVTQMALPLGLVGSPGTAAAATLNRAAENAVRFSDPVLVAGQFLKIEDLSTHPTDIGVTEYSNGERTDRGVLVKYTERGTKYIPADRSKTWTWLRYPGEIVGPYGYTSDADVALVRDERARALGGTPPIERVTGEGGDFYGTLADHPDAPGASLAGLPQEPRALLAYIYAVNGNAGPNPQNEAFVWIADRLRLSVYDASTRALLFRTLALIPGCEQMDGRVSLNGVEAVAIQAPAASNSGEWQVLLDPDTGQYLGERRIGGADARPGEIAELSTTEVSIVDAVPTEAELKAEEAKLARPVETN